MHHIFGSEELSSRFGAIGELAAKPYIAFNRDDAAALNVSSGQELEVSVGGITHRLPVRFVATLASGIAGIPAGIDAFAGMALPAWAKIERTESVGAARSGG